MYDLRNIDASSLVENANSRDHRSLTIHTLSYALRSVSNRHYYYADQLTLCYVFDLCLDVYSEPHLEI